MNMALCPLRTTTDACALPTESTNIEQSAGDCEWIEDGRDENTLLFRQSNVVGPTTGNPVSIGGGRCVMKHSVIETATQGITELILHWKPPNRRLDVHEWDRVLHNLRFSRIGLEIVDRVEVARGAALFLRQAQFKRLTLPMRALFVYAYHMWRTLISRRTAAELTEHLDVTLRHVGQYESGHPSTTDVNSTSQQETVLFQQIKYGVEDLAPAFACVYELTIAAALPSTMTPQTSFLAIGAKNRMTDAALVELLLDRLEPDTQVLRQEHQIHATLRRTLDWAQHHDASDSTTATSSNTTRDALFPAWNVQFAAASQTVRMVSRALQRTQVTIRDDLERIETMPATERENTLNHLMSIWQHMCVGAVIRALLLYQSEVVVLLLLHHYQTVSGRRVLDAHLASLQSQFATLSQSYMGGQSNEQDASVYHQVRLLSHDIWLLEKAKYLVDDTTRPIVQAMTTRRISRVLHTFLALWTGEDQLPGWTQADSDIIVDECLDPLQLQKVQHLLNMRLLLVSLDQPLSIRGDHTIPISEQESPQFQVLAHVWRHICAKPNAVTQEVVAHVGTTRYTTISNSTSHVTHSDDKNLLKERVAEVWDSIQGNEAAPSFIQNALFVACSISITQQHRQLSIDNNHSTPQLAPQLIDIEREATHLLVETFCRVVQEQIVQSSVNTL